MNIVMKFEKKRILNSSIRPFYFYFSQKKMLVILGISLFRSLLFNPDCCLAELYCLFFFLRMICIFGVKSCRVCEVLPRKNV